MKKRKPKIAVYIVGQYRLTAFKCSEYLKKILEDYEVYTFIHIWEGYDSKLLSRNILKYIKPVADVWDGKHTSLTNEDFSKIETLYENVVYFETESSTKNYEISKYGSEFTGLSSFPQFYCAYKCNEQRKLYENSNGIRFDIIFKFRPDVILREDSINNFKFQINSVLENNKKIYSKYTNTLENIKSDVPKNLVWDYYTLSSSYGMDCMMEWVRDILDGKMVYASDYILKYDLLPNIDSHCDFQIVREFFNNFDFKYFFERKYTQQYYFHFKKNLALICFGIFYEMLPVNDDDRKLFYEFYDFENIISKLIPVDKHKNNFDINLPGTWSIHLTREELNNLANYFLERQDEFELLLNKEI